MKKSAALFVLGVLSQLHAQPTSTTAIDVHSIGMANSRLLLGITMDSRAGMQAVNGTSIGYFNSDGTLIPEVASLFSDFPLSTLRYPGNGIAAGFDWKQSIGLPAAARPPQDILGSLGPAQSVAFGFDEFMAWTASKGAAAQDVQIMVSIYDSATTWPDPSQQRQALPHIIQHTADWVEYANAPNDSSNPGGGTDWAAVRSVNGHDQPYGIKMWNMGNEPWSSAEFGQTTAGCVSYLNLIPPMIDAMLAIDPTIHITLPTVGTNTGPTTWHHTILNSALVASGKIYGLSPHAFPVESGTNTKVSNFVSIYSALADSAEAHGLKIILGDYAHGIPQQNPTQVEMDIAMQWQGAILSADFLLAMSKMNNLERVNFWVYGLPTAVWHPLRKFNGTYTLMPTAQLYKKLAPLVLDHSVASTNTSSPGSDGNPYGVNSSSFASSDLSRVNVLAVNRDLLDAHVFQLSGLTGYGLQNAHLLKSTAPTGEMVVDTAVAPGANGHFTIPPMSILVLEYTLDATRVSDRVNPAGELILSPIPSDSQLNFSKFLPAFRITTILGQEILHGNGTSVSTSELGNGIYFLTTNDASRSFIVKHH